MQKNVSKGATQKHLIKQANAPKFWLEARERTKHTIMQKLKKNIHKNKHKQNNQSKIGQRMAAPPNLNETLSPMFAHKRIGQY